MPVFIHRTYDVKSWLIHGGCTECKYGCMSEYRQADLNRTEFESAFMHMLLLSTASSMCPHMEPYINEMTEQLGEQDKVYWLLEMRKLQRNYDDARRREKSDKPKKKRKRVWRKKRPMVAKRVVE